VDNDLITEEFFLKWQPMSVDKSKVLADVSPAEIEAIRFAYRQMREEFPGRYVGENEKRDLARSILEALERPVSREAEDEILKLVEE
jgi:hypothetical protein